MRLICLLKVWVFDLNELNETVADYISKKPTTSWPYTSQFLVGGSYKAGYNVHNFDPSFFHKGSILYVSCQTGCLAINALETSQYSDMSEDLKPLDADSNRSFYLRLIVSNQTTKTIKISRNYSSPGTFSLNARITCTNTSKELKKTVTVTNSTSFLNNDPLQELQSALVNGTLSVDLVSLIKSFNFQESLQIITSLLEDLPSNSPGSLVNISNSTVRSLRLVCLLIRQSFNNSISIDQTGRF